MYNNLFGDLLMVTDNTENEEETAPTETKEEASFADKVAAVVDSMTVDDKGVAQLPADAELPEEVAYAAMEVKRRRDTRSAYLKQAQELAALKAERAALQDKVVEASPMSLTDDQVLQLESMKMEDPDAWREKVNALEKANKATLKEQLDELSEKSAQSASLGGRTELYKQFEADTGVVLTDDMVNNDLPAAYKRGLEDGSLSFEDFLAKSKKFLSLDAVVQTPKEPAKQHNLGKAAGGSSPEEAAQELDADANYKNEIF